MAACRAAIRVLAMTTPRHSRATLDGKDRHDPNPEDEGCHRYGSPNSAGRPAPQGAGGWSRNSRWTLETPTSSVPSNCSAGGGSQVVPGGVEMSCAAETG